MKILHIIQCLSRGGATRSLIAMAKHSAHLGNFEHRVVSLKPADPQVIKIAQAAGIEGINQPNKATLLQEIVGADIVQVHFWNNPEIYQFLRSELPQMRLVFWFHIAGDKPPHVITQDLLDLADFSIASSPYTYNLPVFQNLPAEIQAQKTGMIYATTDFKRVEGVQLKPHETFNVGYIGTTSPVKMHPNYIPMSAGIKIPNILIMVCGGDAECAKLQQQAERLNVAEKFDFRGYIEDIRSVIEVLDVFGYPLCSDNYSTVELVLLEVMYAGVPPVIFAYGGAQKTVIHQETGLIVQSEAEYQQAIEYLYHHPEERVRLGKNAKKYVQRMFGAEKTASKFNSLYAALNILPKRERQLASEGIAGAEYFIESLGETATQFQISLNSSNIAELLIAEEEIALSTPVLYNRYGGGILHYQSHYPEDGYLRLWAGLVWKQQGQNVRAIATFMKALELGCNHWRVYWYLAQVAEKVGATPLAMKALAEVMEAAPKFYRASQMWHFYQEKGQE